MIHLDTHVVIWLHDRRLDQIPEGLRRTLGGGVRLLVSPMVRLELALLHQIGRIALPPHRILDKLRVHADLGVAESAFERVAAIAADLTWTRDPFDRLIVAHAIADDLPLVTKDETILRNCPLACWETVPATAGRSRG